jgi:hypothetical protein
MGLGLRAERLHVSSTSIPKAAPPPACRGLEIPSSQKVVRCGFQDKPSRQQIDDRLPQWIGPPSKVSDDFVVQFAMLIIVRFFA